MYNLQGQIAYAKLNCPVKVLSTNIGAVHSEVHELGEEIIHHMIDNVSSI
jgi:hypothetical protein